MNGIDDKVLNTLRSYKRKIKKPKKFKVYYKILYSNSKNSIFFYTGWGSSPEHFKDIYNPLKHKYNIILFFCPRELLSEDTTKTVNYFEEVKNKTIEAINKLKKTADEVDGDIAGFGDDWIVVTPSIAQVYRNPNTDEVVED